MTGKRIDRRCDFTLKEPLFLLSNRDHLGVIDYVHIESDVSPLTSNLNYIHCV